MVVKKRFSGHKIFVVNNICWQNFLGDTLYLTNNFSYHNLSKRTDRGLKDNLERDLPLEGLGDPNQLLLDKFFDLSSCSIVDREKRNTSLAHCLQRHATCITAQPSKSKMATSEPKNTSLPVNRLMATDCNATVHAKRKKRMMKIHGLQSCHLWKISMHHFSLFYINTMCS